MTTSAADWPKVTLPCSEEETAWGSLRAALIYRLVATGVFDSLVREVLTLRTRRAVVCPDCHGTTNVGGGDGPEPCPCGTGAVFIEEGGA